MSDWTKTEWMEMQTGVLCFSYVKWQRQKISLKDYQLDDVLEKKQ